MMVDTSNLMLKTVIHVVQLESRKRRTRSFMITATQLKAARALLDVDQRELAELSNLSVPTIQRMEASDGVIRGNVDSLMKLVGALQEAGIELINEGAPSLAGGRGVRLREAVKPKRYREKAPRMSAGRAA
jgi:transcriptional regulator with XRE-family HTH domain